MRLFSTRLFWDYCHSSWRVESWMTTLGSFMLLDKSSLALAVSVGSLTPMMDCRRIFNFSLSLPHYPSSILTSLTGCVSRGGWWYEVEGTMTSDRMLTSLEGSWVVREWGEIILISQLPFLCISPWSNCVTVSLPAMGSELRMHVTFAPLAAMYVQVS